MLPVKSAYNYVIGVSNVGSDDIEKPEIDIILSDKASIIDIEVKSDKIPKDKIELPNDIKRPNFHRVIPQYINRKDTFTISVLSIKDTSPECEIMVGGKGIIHQRRRTSVEEVENPIVFARIAALFIWGFIIWLIIERANGIISIMP